MRIDKLYIEEYKNLKEFTVDFDQTKVKQVIVGRNGTGKSNLFEAIANIFKDLDLRVPTGFGYTLEYICNGILVKIENVLETKDGKNIYKRKYAVKLKAKEEKKHLSEKYEIIKENEFYNYNKRLLPSYVFAYYSGIITRLNDIFKEHEKKYYADQIKGTEQPLRPLFLARPHHSQFALLSFFAAEDPKARKFLENEFGITGIESVLFKLREPFWNQKNPSAQKKINGDPRFWYAAGKVKSFLEKLFEYSYAPIALLEKIEVNIDKYNKKERRFCYIPDERTLKKLADGLSPKEFFTRMESMLYSDIINEDGSDVQINISIKNSKKAITFYDLSEGERQLLTVLGLMRFTKESEALFLLDEPDTHQNPAWCLDYLRNLKEYDAEPENCQIIMTTHSPLTFAGLEKEEVVILEQLENGNVYSYHPSSSPIGMGVNAILTSDFFGMRSALDRKTLFDLDRKRELAFKENRSDKEDEEFNDLINALGKLDFSKDARDPLYLEYLKAIDVAQNENPQLKQPAPDSITWEKRKQISKEISKRLLEKKK